MVWRLRGYTGNRQGRAERRLLSYEGGDSASDCHWQLTGSGDESKLSLKNTRHPSAFETCAITNKVQHIIFTLVHYCQTALPQIQFRSEEFQLPPWENLGRIQIPGVKRARRSRTNAASGASYSLTPFQSKNDIKKTGSVKFCYQTKLTGNQLLVSFSNNFVKC
jgi:hypothetical protein